MWKLIGHISVDAGICWIGDPCSISFPYNKDNKNKGLGVCVSTGYGDGFYPVYVKFSKDKSFGKRISEVKVVFIKK